MGRNVDEHYDQSFDDFDDSGGTADALEPGVYPVEDPAPAPPGPPPSRRGARGTHDERRAVARLYPRPRLIDVAPVDPPIFPDAA